MKKTNTLALVCVLLGICAIQATTTPEPEYGNQDLAILIAVSNYASDSIPPTTAVSDAECLKEGFEKQGFRVLILKDTGATFDRVRELLSKQLTSGKIVLWLGGHGILKDNNEYFLCYDADVQSTDSCLNVKAIYNDRNTRFKHQYSVLFLDACKTLVARNAQSKPIPVPKLSVKNYGNNHNFLIAACSAGQSAYENQLGIFSGSLCRLLTDPVLQAAADTDNSSNITMIELYNFLRDNVKRQAANQIPNFDVNGNPYVIFIERKKTYNPDVDNDNTATQEQIADADDEPMDRYSREIAPSVWSTHPQKDWRLTKALNGVSVTFDIGEFVHNKQKTYWVLFLWNPRNAWSTLMRKEFLTTPQYAEVFEASSQFQLIFHDIFIDLDDVEKKVSDTQAFRSGSDNSLWKRLINEITMRSAPKIIFLKKNGDTIVAFNVWRGYAKPESVMANLAPYTEVGAAGGR